MSLQWGARRRVRAAIAGTALVTLLGMVVLALWPTPGKYPLRLPGVVAVTTLLATWRAKREADDFGALLLAFLAVVGLGTWTLSSWFGLAGPVALLVGAGLFVAPLAWLVTALRRAGSADDPDSAD